MQPKQLTPTELIAVSVPADSYDFDYENAHLFYDMPTGTLERSIDLGFSKSDNYEVLGMVTAQKIDFDPSPFVKSVYNGTLKRTFYHDYREGFTRPSHPYRDGRQSLRSLLHLNKAWGENNLIEKLVILKKI